MPVAIEQSAENSTVLLSGDVGIGAARELRGALIEALTSGRGLRIDLSGVTSLDVTTLQLLWAAERAAAKDGTKLLLNRPIPKGVEQAMNLAGLKGLAVDTQ